MGLGLRLRLGLVSVGGSTRALAGIVFLKVVVGPPVISAIVDLFCLDPFPRLGSVDVGFVSVGG